MRIYCSTFNGRALLLAVLALAWTGAARAQTAVIKPDCIIDVTLTAAGQTAGGPGTCGQNTNAVYEWRFAYKSTGFSVLSVIVQSAPDVAGAPGTWVSFAGTITGSNPNTAITQTSTNLVGFQPWVRVLLTSATGAGTITGQLYGCREPGCSIAGATINAIVAIPNPLPVDGPTAAGLPPTTPPVLVSGQDGAPGNIRTLKTDATGELIPANASSAAADGISNTEITSTGAAGGILFPRTFGYLYNGMTWDRMPGNTLGLFGQGPVASGVANAGNPLKIGGPFNSTQPTVTNGQVVDGQFTARGALIVAPGVEPFPVTVCGTAGSASCFVQGAAASGVAVAGNPVRIGASDGTNTRDISSDAAGELIPANASSADADGVSNTEAAPTGAAGGILYPRVFGRVFNGTTWDRARGNTTGAFAQGPVASGVANAGNPLKIGGPFNTTQPTVTNGQVVDGQFTARGALIVAPGVEPFPVTVCGTAGSASCFVQGAAASGVAVAGNPVRIGASDGTNTRDISSDAAGELIPANASSADADGVSNTEAAPTGAAGGILYPRVFGRVFNGTTWDRARGNTTGAFAQGPVASGVANAGNPLKIGGPFNTTQPTVTNGQVVDGQFSARGALIVVPGVEGFPVTGTVTATTVPPGTATAQADGATNTPAVPTVTAGVAETVPSYPYKFNGATWDRDFVCTLSAPITFSAASGSVQIVALASSQIIRVCHLSISSSAATNFTIQYGTGSACGTGTNSLSGAYNNVTTLALDFAGTLRTPASQALCIVSSASVTAGGVVTYALF